MVNLTPHYISSNETDECIDDTIKEINDKLIEKTHAGIKQSKMYRSMFDILKANGTILTFTSNVYNMF